MPLPTLVPSPSLRSYGSDAPNRRHAVVAGLGSLLMVSQHPLAAQTKTTNAEGAEWPQALAVPGGIARIDLGAGATRPAADWGEVPLLVLGDTARWTALVGIALSTLPGPAFITVQGAGSGPRRVDFAVGPKQYPVQKLQVAAGKVDLSAADEARATRDTCAHPGHRLRGDLFPRRVWLYALDRPRHGLLRNHRHAQHQQLRQGRQGVHRCSAGAQASHSHRARQVTTVSLR